MLSDQKLKQIQGLVRGSKVLTEQEKTEWLALIELMNDKQIAELEEILQGPKPVVPPPARPPANPRPAMPHVNQSSLSHISNLPQQMTARRPVASAPPAPAPAPALAPPPPPAPGPSVIPPKPAPMPPIEPKPMPQVQPAPQPAPQSAYSYTPTQSISLASSEDVAAITSSVLHVQNRKAFHKAITDLAGRVGYFPVLTSFERSPLYKDYLDYGQKMLSGKTQNLALSQEEFEFVTDILLSLKVNRL